MPPSNFKPLYMYFRERLGQLSWLKESLNDIDRYVSHHFQVSDLSIVSVYLGGHYITCCDYRVVPSVAGQVCHRSFNPA